MSNTISQCLNPNCQQQNTSGTRVCIRCGTNLVLDNRYRLEKFIGEGGFGRTFKAIDEKKLNKPCVVKQFLPQQIGSAALAKATELFQQEAEGLDQLGTHPQIPDLLAFFEQEGRFYLIQQFIDGQDLLKELNQNGKFSESQIYHLLRELLPVLEFIHSYGIIHRDIKPDNIIRNNQGSLVLIDFGVSKLLSGSILTRMGTIAGTPSYAPPEQMRGMVYPASDLYSLGVTCIRLLTGCLPEEDGSDELFDPINLQWTWRTKVNISSELEKVLDKLLQEKVGERYQDVNSVLQVINSQSLQVINSPSATQAESFFEQGINEFEIGNYQAALSNFNQVITLEPNNAKAYCCRGNAYYRLADYQSSIIDCNQAISLKPDYAEAYCCRGNAYSDLDNWQSAISDLGQTIKLRPDNPYAYCWRADAYYFMGDYQSCIIDCSQAINLKPDYAEAYRCRGGAYSDLEDWQSAISDFNQVVSLEPDYAAAYYGRGDAYCRLGDYQSAISDFSQAIKLQPDISFAYFWRGFAYYNLGDYQSAISDFSQAIKLKPDYAEAYFWRGFAYYNLGDYQSAISDFSQAIKLKPDYAEAYRLRGSTYYNLGDYQSAISDYNQAIKLKPDYIDAYLYRGYSYKNQGNYKAAILDFEQVIRIQPDNADARENLALLYQKIGDSPWNLLSNFFK